MQTEDQVPANWPFPTYKGKPLDTSKIAAEKFVDNSRQHHLDFLAEQEDAKF